MIIAYRNNRLNMRKSIKKKRLVIFIQKNDLNKAK